MEYEELQNKKVKDTFKYWTRVDNKLEWQRKDFKIKIINNEQFQLNIKSNKENLEESYSFNNLEGLRDNLCERINKINNKYFEN